jgi:adenine-specific DNA-methyltransferase
MMHDLRQIDESSIITVTETTAEKLKRKELGTYYTPDDLARILTEWAIQKPTDTLLDPSYGGCAFLMAGLCTLKQQGRQKPGRQIFGVDIDPHAKSFLSDLLKDGARKDQFVEGNFLHANENTFQKRKFSCIVGNPPYINYHDITEKDAELARLIVDKFNLNVNKQASLWAYFLIHSLNFIEDGGRLAMILPCSILRANYSGKIREILSQHFQLVQFICIAERFFDKTQEQGVVLMCDGYQSQAQPPSANITISEVKIREDVRKVLSSITHTRKFLSSDNLYEGLISESTLDLLASLELREDVIKLGDWVNIRIGTVTGGNDYFIQSPSFWRQKGITPKFLSPVIRKPDQIQSILCNDEHIKSLIKKNEKVQLLSLSEKVTITPSLEIYLNAVPEKVRKAWQCRSREPRSSWYIIPNRENPPAFLQYMSPNWPRLIVNESGATCVNNIHRLNWHNDHPVTDWKRLAIGMYSSLAQLSAELVSRSYGGGVLKIEPSEAKKLTIPIIEIHDEAFFTEINYLIMQKKETEATSLVDNRLLQKQMGLSVDSINKIRSARDLLKKRRAG